MSYHKLRNLNSKGFTIIELSVVIVVISILSISAFAFFNNTINQYLSLQQDSMAFGDMAMQSQRITNVLRGLTDITTAENDELTVYAYFSPNDTYVSIIRYYENNDSTALLADVTPMSANPPIGMPITANMETHTIVSNFYNSSSINTFEYLDSGGNNLTTPISDLHIIKGIRVTLAVPTVRPIVAGYSSISTQVSLRNRKTNL